ncbi:MAG TPA: tetratricopeptide repeat protein [Polyangiaceae bacterium]|nr:tetratricopeptide repeat protein [Polyangiaceae bacterium]
MEPKPSADAKVFVDAKPPRAPLEPRATPNSKERLALGSALPLDATLDDATAPRSPLPSSPPPKSRQQVARELIAALRQELDQHPKPLRAGRLWFEAARLLESPLGELKEAADAYLRAHGVLAEHLPSIRGARRVLLTLGRAAEALPLFDAELKLTSEADRKAQILYDKAAVLEDVLGQRKEAREALELAAELAKSDATRVKSTERAAALNRAWDSLGRAFEREANAVKDDARHRSALLAARARLLEAHRGDGATAVELYQQALAGEPRFYSALHALKRLHYGHQRWRDLIQVLEREANVAHDPDSRGMAYYRMGRVWLDRLGSVDDAIAALERAREHLPSDRMILEELARLYEAASQPDKLCQILEQMAEREESRADQLACYLRIAELRQNELEDESKAIVWYERARGVDRAYLPAIQALSELYTRRREFENLIEVHAGEAEAAKDPARRAGAHARIAEILERRLGRPDEAMQQHARALGLVPGYAPSFKALARLLTQTQRYAELIELYERAVDQASETESKVTYLFKIGRLYEDALGSPAQAVVAYRRILEFAPHELGALHALQRAAERAGAFKDLIAALELEAEKTLERRRKLELYLRAGEVAELELGDDALAIASYRRLVDIDRSYAPAYTALGRLYHKAGRYEDLIETYKSELRLLPKGAALSALLFRMGQIYEQKLGRDDDALGAYRRAVEADPTHRAAVRALERRLEHKGAWEELVRVLESELSALDEASQRARALLRIGEVNENRLRAPERALFAYEQALALDPGLTSARDGRVRLLTDARDYRKLVDELEREAAQQRDDRLAIAALLRAGEVYRDELAEPIRAIRAFETVLSRDPGHIEALLALETLYAERGAFEALANVYATEARILSEGATRVAALRELGRLQQSGRVENSDRGRQAFEAILQIMPEDVGALFALERLALSQSDGELLAHIDAKLSRILPDPLSIAQYETRLGEVLEAQEDPQALELYRSALVHDPESIGATRGLSRIAERRADPILLGEAAEREARVSLDVSRAASELVQAAELFIVGSDTERAVQALSRALEIDPDHELSAARLSELLAERGDIETLIALLTRAAGSAKRPSRMADLWGAVADLHADARDDLPAALAALQRAHGISPRQGSIVLKLADLQFRQGHWAEAADRLKQALDDRPTPDLAIEAHLRLALIYDEHLGEPERARAHLDSVLNMEPNHGAALQRLVQLQIRNGKLDQAADTAARLVRVSPARDARITALTLLGRVERTRNQLEAAAHAYEQVVALEGVGGEAAHELRELVSSNSGDGPPFTRYVSALSRYIEETTAPRADAFLEIARALSDRLGQPEAALGWLERGLRAHPQDIALHDELGQALLAAGQHQRAYSEFERVVQNDVGRESAWRRLSEALNGLQRNQDPAYGMSPLVALGFANDLERASVASRAARPAAALPGGLGRSELLAIAPRNSDDPAARLIEALGDIAGKVFPPDLERFGVSARDRLSSKSNHPLRALTERIASIFGLADYELYLYRGQQGGGIEIELTDPVSILVPAQIAGLSESEQTFALARVLATASLGLSPIDRLPVASISALLAAAARLVEPNYGAGQFDEESLASLARRVSRSLPWLGRGPIEDAARAYTAATRLETSEWVLAVKLTAGRAAILLADELPKSLALVRKYESEPFATRLTHDLLRFWVSETCLTLRRRLGLG